MNIEKKIDKAVIHHKEVLDNVGIVEGVLTISSQDIAKLKEVLLKVEELSPEEKQKVFGYHKNELSFDQVEKIQENGETWYYIQSLFSPYIWLNTMESMIFSNNFGVDVSWVSTCADGRLRNNYYSVKPGEGVVRKNLELSPA